VLLIKADIKMRESDPLLSSSVDGRRLAIRQERELRAALTTKEEDINTKANLTNVFETYDALRVAATIGDAHGLNERLSKGAVVNECDSMGNCALHYAAGNGELNIVRQLIQEGGAEIDHSAPASGSNTALHIAAKAGHTEVVTLLVEHSANIERLNTDLHTPLQVACLHQQANCVTELIRAGSDLNTQDKQGHTPLHTSCLVSNNPEIVGILLEALADYRIHDKRGKLPIDLALVSMHRVVVLRSREYIRSLGCPDCMALIERRTPRRRCGMGDPAKCPACTEEEARL
jgi:ankyrin repeat protein